MAEQRKTSVDSQLQEDLEKDEQELIFSPNQGQVDLKKSGDSGQTFEIQTVQSGSETQQLIKEYKRLASFIPKLNYDNSQEVEDLRVDLSILQHRIEQCIDAAKKSNDNSIKNKAKYLEKLYQEISEKIDTMKQKQSDDASSSGGEEFSNKSLREIDIDDKPKVNNQPQTAASGSNEPITLRSFFIKEERLIQPEDRQVEFKHYRYPFAKECKHIILKTIVSMLNTQGGTIMIGIRDQDLSVVGMNIDSKQKDEIILQFMQMLSSVFPAVNEEITIDFIPIKFKWGKWASKTWVCRIAVTQGQLDRFYIIEDSNIQSYVRYQAMCKSVATREIITFIYERAKAPKEKQKKINYAAPDPEGVKNCNMEQDAIDNLSEIDQQKLYDNRVIFTDVQEGFYQKLTDFLHEKLGEEEEINYQMINQRKHIVLQFENIDTTKHAIELLNLEKDRYVYELRHQFNFKKVLMGDVVKSIVVKNEFTFIIDHIDTSKREAFITYMSDWLKEQNIKHVWLNFKLYLALYVLETEKVSEYLQQKKEDISKQFGFHSKVFFGFCRDHIIIKNIDSKTELKKKLTSILQYISYRALVEKDGTTIHVKCLDFYDLLIAFDRIKSAYMDGQFAHFTNHSKIKVFLGFDRYIE